MKIWFQALSPHPSVDPTWRYYDEACERYIPTVARPDTEIHFASTSMRAPKMVVSSYVRYLHLHQVLENAIQAERDGFDAFVLGGMGDLGYAELREVVDIPVVFISEATYQMACLAARKFAVINTDERALQTSMQAIRGFGLRHRALKGGHLGYTPADFLKSCERDPQGVLKRFKSAARDPIEAGAEMLIPGVAPINIFLVEQGLRDIGGVPIFDCQAAVIKATEVLVDMRRLGMPKARRAGPLGVTSEDISTARKVYGLE